MLFPSSTQVQRLATPKAFALYYISARIVAVGRGIRLGSGLAVVAIAVTILNQRAIWRECLAPTQRRCDMNVWVLILFAVLIFAPKSASNQSSRLDFRALSLLLCVIALIAQI